MDKKRMIFASLASVAVLGAGFVASQPASVRAEGAQPAAEKAPTYDDLLNLLIKFEDDAIAAINKRTDLTDDLKEAKRKEIKEFINKDEMLKLVKDAALTVDNVLEELVAAAVGASQIRQSVDKPYVGKYENNKWIKDNANSGSDAKDLTDEQKQAINRESDKIANRDDVQKAREALADLDEKAEKVSKKIELAKKALETKNESVLKLKALYDEAVKSLGESNELTRRLATEYSNNHDEFQALYESTQEQIEELKDYNEQISEVEETLISALQNKISDLDDKIAGAEKDLANSQNGESVEDYWTSGDKDKLEKLQAEQDELQAELDQLLDKVDGQEPAEKPAPAPKPENPAPAPKPEKSADQQAEEDYARRTEEEYNRLTQQQPPKTEKPAEEPTQPEKPVAPKTGWKQENGMWYFYNTDGSMATGWVKDGDTWYYLEASGAMKASQWFKVSDKWYYVNGSGALAVNTTVDGYRVNANGEWV
ncbi:Pneumococcal surface protein A [Streptococcus pneumoniae]|uniref:nucleoside triphosphate hydrolase n=1 Tax=Streptococcus pneumoniae TaxID=1313 RepID=UPI0005E01DC6|nr:nucleoside triphosphate hydrolase [Streptococcus pneumoniae]CIN76192.1 Pneumococcal surface protein A [Streptococcus pneumoniae]CJX99110.1 Pneumococcal surface protein A [Streptococcus pneumoniae]